MKNGNIFEGKSEVIGNDVRIYKTTTSFITVASSEVEKIVAGESPLQKFERRIAGMQPGNIPVRLELATFAKKNNLKKEARSLYQSVLKTAPDNRIARSALGYEKVRGCWYRGKSLKQVRAMLPLNGKWLPPKEFHQQIQQQTNGVIMPSGITDQVIQKNPTGPDGVSLNTKIPLPAKSPDKDAKRQKAMPANKPGINYFTDIPFLKPGYQIRTGGERAKFFRTPYKFQPQRPYGPVQAMMGGQRRGLRCGRYGYRFPGTMTAITTSMNSVGTSSGSSMGVNLNFRYRDGNFGLGGRLRANKSKSRGNNATSVRLTSFLSGRRR
ncbi:hypothetical protein ACFL54_08150 [Planctomycetota bacterium]